MFAIEVLDENRKWNYVYTNFWDKYFIKKKKKRYESSTCLWTYQIVSFSATEDRGEQESQMNLERGENLHNTIENVLKAWENLVIIFITCFNLEEN